MPFNRDKWSKNRHEAKKEAEKAIFPDAFARPLEKVRNFI